MKNNTHTLILKSRHQSEQRESRGARMLPHVEAGFQAGTLTSGCGRSAKFDRQSFYKLSNRYFAEEAPRSFAVEAGVFSALIAMALLPIANSMQAVAALAHSIALF
ncbi:MAG TPA: hypothetical protein VGG02_13075 [Chthoniobacterales bacterium]